MNDRNGSGKLEKDEWGGLRDGGENTDTNKDNIITVDEPALTKHSFWQIRLIYELKPHHMQFSAGEDGDEIAFIDPHTFKDSTSSVEQSIYEYVKLADK